MALLSFCGISTPSLQAQGEQRRSSIFNNARDVPRIPSGEVVASGTIAIDIRSDPFGWTTLLLGRLQQKIQMHAAWRNFGGCQWYFMCPATGRDVSVLWLPPGASRFQSRQSWGRQVAYGSQFESPHDRALSAAQNFRYRLGGKDCLSTLDDFPPKPKWMRWRTYDKIMRRYEVHENVANDRLVEIASRTVEALVRQQISIPKVAQGTRSAGAKWPDQWKCNALARHGVLGF